MGSKSRKECILQAIDPCGASLLATSHDLQQTISSEVPISTTMAPSNKLKDFETVFPKLVKDLEENANQYNVPEEALKWYSDVRPSCFSTSPGPIPYIAQYNPFTQVLRLSPFSVPLPQHRRREMQPRPFRPRLHLPPPLPAPRRKRILPHRDPRLAHRAPTGLLPRLGRHHGLFHHAPWPTLLVP